MSNMPLSADYQPTPYTVVIGKGRLPMQAEGNKNLRTIVKSFLGAYSAADHKSVKSNIVSNVYATIVNSCPEGEAFIKWDGEYFYPVTDHQAREKVAGTFRDLLSHKYKSSSKNKVAKRRQARKQQRKQEKEEPQETVQLATTQPQQEQFEQEMTTPEWMNPPTLEKVVTPEWTLANFTPSASMENDAAVAAPDDLAPPPAFERMRTFSIPSMDALLDAAPSRKSLLLDAPSRKSLLGLMNGFGSFSAAPIDFDFSKVDFEGRRNSVLISDDDLSLSSAESSCMFDQNCHGDCDFMIATV